MDIVSGITVSFVAILGWLVCSFAFIAYTPPRSFIGIVLAVLIAATMTVQ